MMYRLLKEPILPHQEQIMLTNLACPISRLRREWDYNTVQSLHRTQTRSHSTEGWKGASEDKWMILQCATFSKYLNLRIIEKSVSDIRILIRFPFQSSFWISVSGCKLTILPDIQPANRIAIALYNMCNKAYLLCIILLWAFKVRNFAS